MVLTATATQGFEFDRVVDAHEVMWLPGDPGVTFTRGDHVNFSNGVLVLCTTNAAQFTVEKTTVCPAATAYGFPVESLDNDGFWGSNADIVKCFVPCRPRRQVGACVEKATFSGQFDDTVAACTQATPSITLTTSPGANDDTNGALIYCYAGTGAGQWNIGDDYVHTTKVLTTHRKWNTALSTDSKIIVLEGEGGSVGGIGYGTRVDHTDHNNITVANGYNDGPSAPFMDARGIPALLKNLTMKVIDALDVL